MCEIKDEDHILYNIDMHHLYMYRYCVSVHPVNSTALIYMFTYSTHLNHNSTTSIYTVNTHTGYFTHGIHHSIVILSEF